MPSRDNSGYTAGREVGDLLLAVRKDTGATLATADAFVTPLQVDANGCLYVTAGGGSVSSSITAVVPGTGATQLGKAEDAAHATGHTGVMALAVRTDTPANRSDTDGDYEPLQMSAGRLWVSAVLTAGSAAVGTVALGTEVTTAISATGSNLDVDTAAEVMTASSIVATKGIVVKAAAANTGIVYVGKDNTVTAGTTAATDGYPLSPGEPVTLPINNANLVWLIASANNQAVFFLAI